MLLASGAVGLFLMLVLPGLATAAPAVADPTLVEQPSAAATPASEATPVDATAPVQEEAPPAEEQPAQPAPSGDGTTPATDDGAGSAPAPPPSESTPIAAPTDGSTPAPQPVEAAPAPSTGSALPVQPDAPVVPADQRPAAALAASTWDAATTPTQAVSLPEGPESQMAPAVAATAPDPAPAPAAERSGPPAPPAARDLTDFTFDASGPIAQPITAPRQAAPVPFAHEVQPPDNLTVELVAPQGAAPGGSSLLAVLASYILPGSGPVPPSALMMLVLLGLILAAVFAPRPAGSERIWLSGLLGPTAGHGLAVPRPG